MAYRVMQRTLACRAPPGVRSIIWSRKSSLRQKNGGFFRSSYRHLVGSMVACNRRKDRDRQITNGVGSDDTAVIPGDIINFFKEDDKYGS